MKVRAFIYIDEYKMHSISSQLFEGTTDYITQFLSTGESEKEEQKGNIGSGRIMADISMRENRTEERKYLYDYAYAKFEDELFEKN